MRTLAQWLQHATAKLKPFTPTPDIDARALACAGLALDRTQLIADPQRTLSSVEAARLNRLLARREHGEPIAYIVGRREFWSLPFGVSGDVLIPRPETELAVERALAHIDGANNAACRICDLGTGSGAIAIALAHERRAVQITAVDLSSAALAVARANAAALKIDAIRFVQGDWFAPLAHERFDIVVSNPPYVRDDDPHLREGDLRFEPSLALRGGSDGLDAYRRIIGDAPAHLVAGGRVILEHGFDQAAAIGELLQRRGFVDIESARDLAGHERVTEAVWRSPPR